MLNYHFILLTSPYPESTQIIRRILSLMYDLLHSPSLSHTVFCEKNGTLHSVNANINFIIEVDFILIQALDEVVARILQCHVQSVISPYVASFYKLSDREIIMLKINFISK